MKTLILFIFLVALMQPVFCHEKQKDSINIGYYVVIQKNGKFESPFKTKSP